MGHSANNGVSTCNDHYTRSEDELEGRERALLAERVVILQFEQPQSGVDYRLQEVHGNIELDQVASKNSICVEQFDQEKETGEVQERREIKHRTPPVAPLTSPLQGSHSSGSE